MTNTIFFKVLRDDESCSSSCSSSTPSEVEELPRYSAFKGLLLALKRKIRSSYRPPQARRIGENGTILEVANSEEEHVNSLTFVHPALLGENDTILEVANSEEEHVNSSTFVHPADFEVFASREFTTNQVLDALKHEGINLVGVYGMAGAGKTMLVTALASHVKEEKMFEEVVTVIVSQNPDTKIIQAEIAKRLSLSLKDDDSISLRAEQLSERLNQRKKTLVILDDLWQRVELSEVGIPRNSACKVLLTTRFQDVCNEMDTQKKIEVTVLSDEDSWSLFRENAGHGVDSTLLQAVARAVLNECGGLPLVIITIGRALRDQNANVWAAALVQLKKSAIFEGMSPVISSIRLSYDSLPNQETKLCFLFCGLFPEDFRIRYEVLWYLMGENLIRNVDGLEEARGKLHAIVDKLVSSCLLLEVKNPLGDALE